jgi:hypothetical protein
MAPQEANAIDDREQTHPDETEAFLAARLVEFDKEVALLTEQETKFLRQAQANCSELLDQNFKLMFLRTDVFNVQLAVKRYASYWEHRVDLFGPEKAFLPMTLDGAMKDDLETLALGYTRTVQDHGRILFMDPSRTLVDRDIDSIVRCQWYVSTKALMSEPEMQKKGAIFVLDLDTIRHFDRPLIKRMAETTNDSFPLRVSLCCMINPPPLTDFFVKIVKLFMKPKVRQRLYVIKGDQKLVKHVEGLDMKTLYTALDHDKWIETMREKEG